MKMTSVGGFTRSCDPGGVLRSGFSMLSHYGCTLPRSAMHTHTARLVDVDFLYHGLCIVYAARAECTLLIVSVKGNHKRPISPVTYCPTRRHNELYDSPLVRGHRIKSTSVGIYLLSRSYLNIAVGIAIMTE